MHSRVCAQTLRVLRLRVCMYFCTRAGYTFFLQRDTFGSDITRLLSASSTYSLFLECNARSNCR